MRSTRRSSMVPGIRTTSCPSLTAVAASAMQQKSSKHELSSQNETCWGSGDAHQGVPDRGVLLWVKINLRFVSRHKVCDTILLPRTTAFECRIVGSGAIGGLHRQLHVMASSNATQGQAKWANSWTDKCSCAHHRHIQQMQHSVSPTADMYPVWLTIHMSRPLLPPCLCCA